MKVGSLCTEIEVELTYQAAVVGGIKKTIGCMFRTVSSTHFILGYV